MNVSTSAKPRSLRAVSALAARDGLPNFVHPLLDFFFAFRTAAAHLFFVEYLPSRSRALYWVLVRVVVWASPEAIQRNFHP